MNLLGDPEYQKIRCYQQLVHILGLAAALRLAFDLGDRLVHRPQALVGGIVLKVIIPFDAFLTHDLSFRRTKL